MRPIVGGEYHDAEPLADNERLVALTPQDFSDISAGLKARRLMLGRDILLRSHTGKREVPEDQVELERIKQLEANFQQFSD